VEAGAGLASANGLVLEEAEEEAWEEAMAMAFGWVQAWGRLV
jgi:hypothetical protein